MNPLNYSLAEVQKAAVAGLFLIFAVLALVFTVPVGFDTACVALVGPVFMVIGVFAAKNHSADDLQKALEALKGAAITVVGYFTVMPVDLGDKLAVAIAAIVAVVGVYWRTNAPARK